MEIAARIKDASKEYKAGDTVIMALQPTTFEFRKKELTLIINRWKTSAQCLQVNIYK